MDVDYRLVEDKENTKFKSKEDIAENGDWRAAVKEAALSNMEDILKNISDEMIQSSVNSMARKTAAYKLKCALTSEDPNEKVKKREKWLSFSEDTRSHIKRNVLRSLSLDLSKPNTVAQCVSSISCAELPRGDWKELAGFLDDNVTSSESSEKLKGTTLETISYICDEIDPKPQTDRLDNVVIKTVYHVFMYEESSYLKFTALNLFLKWISHLNVIFENEPEKQLMLDAVYELTKSENSKINLTAMECLENIMLFYYKHMRVYLSTNLLNMTISVLSSEDNHFIVRGVHFLETVCSQEEKIRQTIQVDIFLQEIVFFGERAVKQLLPILMQAAAKMGNVNESSFFHKTNLKKIKFCVGFLATTHTSVALQHVYTFVDENIESATWKYRRAALLSFDAVIRTCSEKHLTQLFNKVLPKFSFILLDTSLEVKVIAVTSIIYLCEHFQNVVMEQVDLEVLVERLLEDLDVKSITGRALHAASYIAYCKAKKLRSYNFGEDEKIDSEQLETYCLSCQFDSIVKKLLNLLIRSKYEENLVRICHTTLYCMIKESPKDCSEVLSNIVSPLLEHVGQLLKDDFAVKFDHPLTFSLPILKCTLKMISSDNIIINSDETMSLVNQILMNTNKRYGNVILKEAFKIVAVVAEKLGNEFIIYLNDFKPFLTFGLISILNNNFEDIDISYFNAVIRVVAEISHSVGDQISTYYDEIMPSIFAVAKCDFVRRKYKLKPIILIFSIITDCAKHLGLTFKKYYEYATNVIEEFTKHVEKVYTNKTSLREFQESFKKVCSAITNALKDQVDLKKKKILLHCFV